MKPVEYEVARLAFEDHDYAKALGYLLQLATRGHPKAQHLLGFMYAEGLGVSRDGTEAARWFREAAALGLKEAQVELFMACDCLEGVPTAHVEVVPWLRHAADHGVKEAQVALGFKYARGQGVPQDDVEAARLFHQAAEHGSNEACLALGFIHTDGRGVPQSDTEAVKWFRTAADRGLRIAQTALGFMYTEGRGVARDYVQAHMWLHVSDVADDADLHKQLDSIAAEMSTEQVAKAERLARDWKPRQ